MEGTFSTRTVSPELIKKIVRVAVIRRVPWYLRWSFIAFVFTLPFEAVDLGFTAGLLSLPKLAGYFFFLSYALYRVQTFTSGNKLIPDVPAALWWFLTYLTFVVVNAAFVAPEHISHAIRVILTLFQLVVLFWIASSLLQDRQIARAFLLTYSVASVALALAIILRVPGFSVTVEFGRVTALGDNPNAIGLYSALALVVIVGLCTSSALRRTWSKIFFLVSTLPVFVVMVQSGSRAGILAFIIGCLTYAVPHWRPKKTLAAVSLGILAVVIGIYLTVSNPDSMERWHQTYYEGDLASRQRIFPTAIEMFFEKPILGWRPVEFWYELGFRLGFWSIVDAHNLILHLLLEVGIIGTIPFLIGLGLCGYAAWKARTGVWGLLPLAVLLATVVNAMSGTNINVKLFWLFLALAVAAGTAAARERPSIVLTRVPRRVRQRF